MARPRDGERGDEPRNVVRGVIDAPIFISCSPSAFQWPHPLRSEAPFVGEGLRPRAFGGDVGDIIAGFFFPTSDVGEAEAAALATIVGEEWRHAT